MNLRNSWMTNNTLFGVDYQKNLLLQEVKDRFDRQRYESNEGYSITIDSAIEQVVIQGHINPINADNKDRKLFCSVDSAVHLGSIVLWDSRIFLVSSKPESNQAYLSMRMLECNYTLKWKNESNQTISSPSIVENFRNQTDGIKEGKFLIIGDNELYVTLPNNSDTEKLVRNNRFIVGEDVYKVSKVDDYTKPGLIYLTFKEDQKRDSDDFVNGIADNSDIFSSNDSTSPPSSNDHYIEIIGSETVKTGLTELLTATIYNNSVLVTGESVNWSIVNEDGTTNPLYISIVSTTETTCTIEGLNNLNYIGKWSVLRAELSTDSMIFDEIRIQLISII